MKLLLLYENPIAGAAWVGTRYEIPIRIPAYYHYCYWGIDWGHFLLLNSIGEAIFVNNGHKIRFQKLLWSLNLPKGLNEF